jgi:hypothetical protein
VQEPCAFLNLEPIRFGERSYKFPPVPHKLRKARTAAINLFLISGSYL